MSSNDCMPHLLDWRCVCVAKREKRIMRPDWSVICAIIGFTQNVRV